MDEKLKELFIKHMDERVKARQLLFIIKNTITELGKKSYRQDFIEAIEKFPYLFVINEYGEKNCLKEGCTYQIGSVFFNGGSLCCHTIDSRKIITKVIPYNVFVRKNRQLEFNF